MNIINTPNMPTANGHYSQCIEHNGLLYLSGQLPMNKTTRIIPETLEEQVLQALTNIEKILKEVNADRNDIIQCRIYISNIDLWDRVNTEYSKFFQNHKPVRTIIPSRELHFGALVEIEVLAISKK